MAVTASTRDSAGATLDTKISQLSSAKTATTSTALKEALAVQIDLAQREAVVHYMEHGRLSAATILSTMT